MQPVRMYSFYKKIIFCLKINFNYNVPILILLLTHTKLQSSHIIMQFLYAKSFVLI